MTLTLETTDLGASLKDKHARAADRAAEWMRAYRWAEEPGYVPPASDDPGDWRGISSWIYRDWLYRQHITALVDLERLGKPFACPPCGDPTGRIYTTRLCLDHAWEESGYEWVLRSARQLTRDGYYPGPLADTLAAVS